MPKKAAGFLLRNSHVAQLKEEINAFELFEVGRPELGTLTQRCKFRWKEQCHHAIAAIVHVTSL